MKPRDTLNEAGWAALRAACPASRDENRLDLRVARQLLDNPVVYARILGHDPVRMAHTFNAAAAH